MGTRSGWPTCCFAAGMLGARVGIVGLAWLLLACGSNPDPSGVSDVDAGTGGVAGAGGGTTSPDSGAAPDTAPPLPEYEGFSVSNAQAEGIDENRLAALVATGAEQKSSALIVIRNGRLVLEEYYGGSASEALVAMSASKSIASLGAGLALDEGKLTSLEQPVTALVPELAADPEKSGMQVGHLLNHTSGLDTARATSGSIVTHAASSPMVFAPGTSAQYNNNAVDLLAAVIGRAVGIPLDGYLDDKLFAPLGAHGQYWMKDSVGVPKAAGELFVRPIDAAKVGQLMLDRGKWHGQQVVSESWVNTSIDFNQPFDKRWGRLWWNNADVLEVQVTQDILDHWKRVGVPDTALDKAQSLLGKSFASFEEVVAEIKTLWTSSEYSAFVAAYQKEPHLPIYHATKMGPTRGFYAAGWLGQFIVVCTENGIVGVRMRFPVEADYTNSKEQNGFREFPTQVCELAAG